MPREHKTKYAILGLLAREPLTGYEIKKKIEEGLSNFWSESYGQLYPTIKSMEQEGLITRTHEKTTEGKPDRYVCTITDEGRQVLKDWLKEPAEPHRERVEVLLKLCFGNNISLEDNIKHVQRFKEENISHLEHYREVEHQLTTYCPDDPDAPYWAATVRCGITGISAMVQWCDQTLQMLERMQKGKSWLEPGSEK